MEPVFRLVKNSFGVGFESFFVNFLAAVRRGNCDKVCIWMPQKQRHKLLAGVTGRANYGDLGLAAVVESRVYSFFHRAQCVFRFDLIATRIASPLVRF